MPFDTVATHIDRQAECLLTTISEVSGLWLVSSLFPVPAKGPCDSFPGGIIEAPFCLRCPLVVARPGDCLKNARELCSVTIEFERHKDLQSAILLEGVVS